VIPISTTALAVWAVVLFIFEQRFPAAQSAHATRARIAVNLTLGLLVFALSPLIQWVTVGVLAGVHPIIDLIAMFGPISGLILQLLILDLWTYSLHRAYHRVPAMWRLHAPHHLDQHLDVTSAVRFHVGEILWSSLLRLIPLLLFGISFQTNLLFGAILTGCALFHHSNVRLPPRFERVVSLLIVTPSIHWVHHHAVRRDTDANYASILSIWDRIFGSFSPTQRTPNMPVGVEGAAELPLRSLITYPISGL
jgi:sterol desaturase/sphingolipid hydroxylase (fatty acid hydroxylase superfamily)